MLDADLADHLLLGTDVGRRNMLESYNGGPGMTVLPRTFPFADLQTSCTY